MALSPLESISRDLGWREAELGSLKLLLARQDITDHQRTVLLRACWALLYAHYEGFSKNALTIFFDEAKRRAQNCGSLPQLTKLFALEKTLKRLRSLPSNDFLSEIESFSTVHHIGPPEFPEVETKSNLWPSVLQEILDAADINLPALNANNILIKTLVSRRNKIAHGNNEIIQDASYYRSYEAAVYDLMYELAFGIEDRLSRAPYI